MDPFTLCPQHPCHGILGEPVDMEVGDQLTQFSCDRDIALCM